MLENLLLDVKHGQVTRNSLNAIWLVYLAINLLKTLIERFKVSTLLLSLLIFTLSNVLLPVEKSSRK